MRYGVDNRTLLKQFYAKGKRKHKYGAEKTKHDGYSFASKGEAALYAQLKLEERAGLIADIQVQDHVYLTDARVLYVADFKVRDLKTGEDVWIEFKGFQTPEWRIKRRLWQSYGPGRLIIYGQGRGRISIIEEIKPTSKIQKNEP